MIRTVHYGEIQWHYPELGPLSNERFAIEDKITAKVVQLCNEQPEVSEDTELRCQWEGRRLESENLAQLTVAHDQLLAYIKRFKHIELI